MDIAKAGVVALELISSEVRFDQLREILLGTICRVVRFRFDVEKEYGCLPGVVVGEPDPDFPLFDGETAGDEEREEQGSSNKVHTAHGSPGRKCYDS